MTPAATVDAEQVRTLVPRTFIFRVYMGEYGGTRVAIAYAWNT